MKLEDYAERNLSFGMAIKVRRMQLKLSAVDVAKAAGLSASVYNRIEQLQGVVKLDHFFRVCQSLDLNPFAFQCVENDLKRLDWTYVGLSPSE